MDLDTLLAIGIFGVVVLPQVSFGVFDAKDGCKAGNRHFQHLRFDAEHPNSLIASLGSSEFAYQRSLSLDDESGRWPTRITSEK